MEIQRIQETGRPYPGKIPPTVSDKVTRGVNKKVTEYLGNVDELNAIREEGTNIFTIFEKFGIKESVRTFLKSPLLPNKRYIRFFECLNFYVVKTCKKGSEKEQELRQSIPLIRDFIKRLKDRNSGVVSAFKASVACNKIGMKKVELKSSGITEEMRQKMITQARQGDFDVLAKGLECLVTVDFLDSLKNAAPIFNKLNLFSFN